MGNAIVLKYHVSTEDFTRAGEASSDVKGKLKQMGVSPAAVRKVAIAMYEGEINMVIHARGGEITVEITPEQIKMVLADVGPGIPDIDKKKYTDHMEIETELGVGTTITMLVNL